MKSITTKTVFILMIIFSYVHAFAQEDSVVYRVILIGDAGELKNEKNNVVDAVKKKFDLNNKKTITSNLYIS